MGRSTEKTCKDCGKKIDLERLTSYCKECLGKRKTKEMKIYYEQKQSWRKKLKWRERLTLVEAKMPTEEDWNDGFNPSITKSICAYCKDIHYEDQLYYHPFMKKVQVYGITLEDIEELMDEAKEEYKKGKTTNQILKERGLDVLGIVEEELNE